MNDEFQQPPLEESITEIPGPPPPRPRGWPRLAWTVIVLLVLLIVVNRFLAARSPAADADDRLGLVVFELQARYLVGAAQFIGRPAAYDQAEALDRGPVAQRLRFITIAGELGGPHLALVQLRQLDALLLEYRDRVTLTAEQIRLRKLLGDVYRDYAALRPNLPSLSFEDRVFLREQLGWFAELALTPPLAPLQKGALVIAVGPALAAPLAPLWDEESLQVRRTVLEPAQQTFLTLVLAVGAGIFFGLIGLVGLVLLISFAAAGKVRGGLETGSLHAGIYAETFALWMTLFIGLGFAARWAPLDMDEMAVSAGVMLLSLLALAWPVVRGIPWRVVCEETGLTIGRRPVLESLFGIATYLMAMPLLLVGVLLVYVLIFLQRQFFGLEGDPFAPAGGPAHPIVEVLAQGDWTVRLQVFFLAAVVAPVVEETMFRGVLYRQVREASSRLGRAVSIIFSALAVSFVFAVIHPQGLVAVPALMALAIGFSIAREWRVTLIPAIVAHGLNNALVTALAILAFSS